MYRTVYCARCIDRSSTYFPKHFIQMGAVYLSGQSEGVWLKTGRVRGGGLGLGLGLTIRMAF